MSCVFSSGTEFSDRFYTAESVEANEVLSWSCFWILFFAIGASVDFGDLVDVSRRVRGLSLGLLFHYGLTPLIALIWGVIFRANESVDRIHAASLFILACVPGSPQSVILTWQSRGDVGLAVLLLILTSCLDAVIFPAWSYYWASILPGDTCYVTMPTLDLLLGHILLILPLALGIYSRFHSYSIIFWFQKYSHILTVLYILVITLSRFIEWEIQNVGGFSLLMTFLFILLNASCVYISSLLLLTPKQAKSLLFQLSMASLVIAYPATQLTFTSSEAIDPIVCYLFWSCLMYPVAFYFAYASQNEETDMKIPQPMFFDKNVSGLFQTVRHLNQFHIGLHDDFAVQGTAHDVEVSSNEEQESVYSDGSREPYDPLSSVASSMSDMQTRGAQREERFLTVSEVKAGRKVTQGATIVPVPMGKPAQSDFSDGSPRSNDGVELMPVRASEIMSNLTPKDSPEPRRISSRSRKRRKKRAKKAKRLVRNLSPASDSSDDSDGTGVESTTSTDFTTVGNSDVTSRIRYFNSSDRPQTVIRNSRKKKKKKKKSRSAQRSNPLDAYSTTPSISHASSVNTMNGYQPVQNPMNVPVFTSSYVGSDMMNGPYHGEGMSLASTHYSHHLEPGATQQSPRQWQQYQYPSYHSNSVPSQTYAYYYN